MKKLTLAFLAVMISFGTFAQQKDTVRILGIGNSWTRDSMRWLSAIGKSSGKYVIVGHGYLGGSNLEDQFWGIDDTSYVYHHKGWIQKVHSTYQYWKYDNANNPVKTPESKVYQNGKAGIGVTLESVVKDEPWDYIVFQPSQTAFSDSTFRSYVGEADTPFNMLALVDKIKGMMAPEVAERVKCGLMIPFSYAQGTTRHTAAMWKSVMKTKDIGNQSEWDEVFEKYHSIIQSRSDTLARFMGKECSVLVNVGEAIHQARKDPMLSAEGYKLQRKPADTHLSEGAPKYLASLCYAYSILGIEEEVKFDLGDYVVADRAQQIAFDVQKSTKLPVPEAPKLRKDASTQEILLSMQHQMTELQAQINRLQSSLTDSVRKAPTEVIPAKKKNKSHFYWSFQFSCFFSHDEYLEDPEQQQKAEVGSHFSYAFKPAFGYVFNRNLSVGTFLIFSDCRFSGLSKSSLRYILANALIGAGLSTSDYLSWKVQPYVRYRLTKLIWDRVNLWAELSVYAGQSIPRDSKTHKLNYDDFSTIYGAKLRPMVTCNLNRNLMVFTTMEFLSWNGSCRIYEGTAQYNNSFNIQFIPIYSILSGIFHIGILKRF